MATQEQIGCIFCGRSVIRERIDLEKFDNWDIDWKVLQVREILAGPGRGHKGKSREHGFPAIDEESLSIVQMVESGDYSEVVDAIKGRLVKIVKAYIEAGIISKDDLL